MSKLTIERHSSFEEVVREMDRRAQVIESLEAHNQKLIAALQSYDAHMDRMQKAATKHLTTHWRDVFINTMIYLLDGPEQREVKSLARAALAAQPAPSPWRPIETAPKDGTQFLTWDSHYGIRVGRCVVRPDHDDWLSYMDAYKGSSKGGIRATHWMPLPQKPRDESHPRPDRRTNVAERLFSDE